MRESYKNTSIYTQIHSQKLYGKNICDDRQRMHCVLKKTRRKHKKMREWMLRRLRASKEGEEEDKLF